MGHLLGYARVSTTDQQPQLQVDALTAAGCYRVFTETASGAVPTAPPSSSCWTSCAPATPWSFGAGSLGRSLRHLVDTITSLADRGVGFRSLREAIDTTTRWQARLPRLRRSGRVRNATSSANAPAPDWPPPGPRPPRRPTIGYDHPQAPGIGKCTALGSTPWPRSPRPGVSRASVYRHLTGDSR